jgi:membrane-bound lytic murein transglycosylase D
MKTDDINEIVWNTTGRRFGFASENFFAEFLAALHVESRAKEYFGKVEVSPQLVYEEVVLPKAFAFNQLLQLFRNPKDEDGEETARLYNPYFASAVLRGGRAVPAGYKVRVPKGDSAKVVEILQRPEMLKAEVRALDKSGFYKILPGDTLSGISQELGVPVRALLEANNIDNSTVLRPGRRLVVPQGDIK